METLELYSHKEPKDKKRSIRDKYKRRLKNLAFMLDEYIMHAEERLNEKKAGKIRNKKETQELLQKCTELRNIIQIAPIGMLDDTELTKQEIKELTEKLGLN